MSSPVMRYPICHPQEIEDIALDLVNKMLSRKSILDDVVLSIHTTAITQRHYTRTLALLVKLMVDDLFWRNSDLYATFQDEIVDILIATYIDYWMNEPEIPKERRPSVPPSSIDPLAISAFIGDLTSLGLLSFSVFKTSVSFLLTRMKTKTHLQCIRALFSHAGAYATPEMAPEFLHECMKVVRKRCERHLGIFTLEEQRLRHLMNHLIHRGPRSYFPQFWDEQLNVEEALMASVCIQPGL